MAEGCAHARGYANATVAQRSLLHFAGKGREGPKSRARASLPAGNSVSIKDTWLSRARTSSCVCLNLPSFLMLLCVVVSMCHECGPH